MDPFLGEIRIFSGNFAPRGWALCDGQLLAISQFSSLFTLLGTMYGGNGTSNFALPNLGGSVPIGQGDGPGLTPRVVAETGGSDTVSLTQASMPAHNHIAMGSATNGTTKSPANAVWSQNASGGRPPIVTNLYGTTGNTVMAPAALSPTGDGVPHNNMQPFLAMRFIVCLNGIFPPRS